MADKSAIEWTEATWNPLTGCTKVSPGCDNCYAETFAERFRGVPGHHFEQGFDLQLRPERMEQPIRWKRPRRIFVNSMSDLFHKEVPDDFIAQVFAVMALAPQHTFQMLTKRHARMRILLGDDGFVSEVAQHIVARSGGGPSMDHLADAETGQDWWPLRNVWMGVSVEDQKWADIRIPALLTTPAAVRWISAEPMLGPVDLREWTNDLPEDEDGAPYLGGLDWVVVGGESGPGARPMHQDWVFSLRDQCAAARVPFLFKQWGNWVAPLQMPEDAWQRWDAHHAGEDPTKPVRLAKKAAGRLLDDVQHDGYPALTR